jgi:hypothetical protein
MLDQIQAHLSAAEHNIQTLTLKLVCHKPMNWHIVLTENSITCCLIQAYFTVVPWQSKMLPFLTDRAPLSSGRFLSSVASVLRKNDHRFARFYFAPLAGYIC